MKISKHAAALAVIVGDNGPNHLVGSNRSDQISGLGGNDLIEGRRGNDLLLGDTGNDTLVGGTGNDVIGWDPGDGNDRVEGGDGTDTMLFNGSGANETIDVSAQGQRVRFFRDVAAVTMDLNDTEIVQFNALAGVDAITVNDLAGTDVDFVKLDLAATLGGSAGDGAIDTTIANGSKRRDDIEISGSGTSVEVEGLAATISIEHAEATDRLVVRGVGGNDTIDASDLAAGVIGLTLDGGDGNDTIIGGSGVELLLGGNGNDEIEGERGDDIAFLGAGNDSFEWDPGDGSDTIEGQSGFDTMDFDGAAIAENIDISANGGRAIFFRDIAAVRMDTNDLEKMTFDALGGPDTITVNDLTGTEVEEVELDLGRNDGAADLVTVIGAAKKENIFIHTSGSATTVSGTPADVEISGADALDRLVVDGGAGNDKIDASGLKKLSLVMLGGLGADKMIGGDGAEFFAGGDGNDTALMGGGNDTFGWAPGEDNDTLDGQAGFDTMLFNGAGVAENIDISRQGGDVHFFRDVAAVLMKNDSVENIVFNALGGEDNMVVNDLTGTDQQVVNFNLAGSLGGSVGDHALDTVTVHGTGGADVVEVSGSGNSASVDGLAAIVNVQNADEDDILAISLEGGNDVFDGSGLAAGVLQLVVDGGAGNDVIIGSGGDDFLFGGLGNDVLLGGGGTNILAGGGGSDIFVGGDGVDIVITDWVSGSDQIDLSDVAGNIDYDWVVDHYTLDHGDAVIEWAHGSVVVEDTRLAGLPSDGFIF